METQKPFLEKGSHTATCRNQHLCPQLAGRIGVLLLLIAKWLQTSWNKSKSQEPIGEGVLRMSSDGDDQMGAKIKTQKNP